MHSHIYRNFSIIDISLIHSDLILIESNFFIFSDMRWFIFGCILMATMVLSCRQSEFQCGNGVCVTLNKVCNLIDNCGDGTDEPRQCSRKWIFFSCFLLSQNSWLRAEGELTLHFAVSTVYICMIACNWRKMLSFSLIPGEFSDCRWLMREYSWLHLILHEIVLSHVNSRAFKWSQVISTNFTWFYMIKLNCTRFDGELWVIADIYSSFYGILRLFPSDHEWLYLNASDLRWFKLIADDLTWFVGITWWMLRD